MKIKYRINITPRMQIIKHLNSLDYSVYENDYKQEHKDVEGEYAIYHNKKDGEYHRLTFSEGNILNCDALRRRGYKPLSRVLITKDNVNEIIGLLTLERLSTSEK